MSWKGTVSGDILKMYREGFVILGVSLLQLIEYPTLPGPRLMLLLAITGGVAAVSGRFLHSVSNRVFLDSVVTVLVVVTTYSLGEYILPAEFLVEASPTPDGAYLTAVILAGLTAIILAWVNENAAPSEIGLITLAELCAIGFLANLTPVIRQLPSVQKVLSQWTTDFRPFIMLVMLSVGALGVKYAFRATGEVFSSASNSRIGHFFPVRLLLKSYAFNCRLLALGYPLWSLLLLNAYAVELTGFVESPPSPWPVLGQVGVIFVVGYSILVYLYFDVLSSG